MNRKKRLNTGIFAQNRLSSEDTKKIVGGGLKSFVQQKSRDKLDRGICTPGHERKALS